MHKMPFIDNAVLSILYRYFMNLYYYSSVG
ncbi:hypothetical protein [Plasmodium yoelii yoelii]|uniref:Uncharacterized protein n=1 Tax=Plasmodium yoelii yoelii TaxID=73239 RepID=Q7RTA7_PLAYO|nr:hypothetical protein [Plasmodium yoelii yoelii]